MTKSIILIVMSVCFAHNWNDGILELWKNGFWPSVPLPALRLYKFRDVCHIAAIPGILSNFQGHVSSQIAEIQQFHS